MPISESAGGKANGVAFLVSSGIMFEIIAAACSSPQTAEINADKRAETLMKWVNIGIGTGAAFVIIAAILDDRKAAILGGGALAGTLMYIYYAHAKEAGLNSCKPGTES